MSMPSPLVRAPAPRLAPYLSELCAVECVATAQPSLVLPAWAPAIIVRARRDREIEIVVRGAATTATIFHGASLAWAIGVQLVGASARSLLGVSLAALVDVTVPLAALWRDGAGGLADSLAAAPNAAARLGVLEHAIERRLSQAGDDRRDGRVTVRAALAAIAADTPVRALADQVGTSARQLRRHFHELVGIGPKECAALLRIERATERLAARDASLAEVAIEAGYCDQAHMNLEFRRRLGISPGAWLARA
jgi:AraC-like DNA-binding protein